LSLPATIQAKDLVLETAKADSTWDSNTLQILGNVSGGTLISIRDKPVTKRVNNRLVQVPGPVHYHIISDMNAALGTLITIPRCFWFAGNVGPSGLTNIYDAILKTMVIFTSGTAGTRTLTLHGNRATSKTAAANQSQVDMLDRELAWPANQTLSLGNGDLGGAGDEWTVTWTG
jgi:hypothetical protein